MSIVNVLLGGVLIIVIVIILLLCFAIGAVIVISIWAIVSPWVSPLIDAWSDWVERRTQ